jgi:hypothetical protein
MLQLLHCFFHSLLSPVIQYLFALLSSSFSMYILLTSIFSLSVNASPSHFYIFSLSLFSYFSIFTSSLSSNYPTPFCFSYLPFMNFSFSRSSLPFLFLCSLGPRMFFPFHGHCINDTQNRALSAQTCGAHKLLQQYWQNNWQFG